MAIFPMHTDPLFYRLFQERPALAFDLAGLAVPEAADYRMRAIEVKQTAFRLDGVLLPPPGRADAPLIFTEAQFQGRPTFYARWLASIFLFLYRHRVTRPWQAVVVFPHRQADAGILTPYEGLLQCGLLRRVYLEDLLEVPGLSFDARLARLVILEATRAATEARALVSAPDPAADPLEVLDLVETILVYKFPQLSREEIRAMLQLPETNLKKTRFYQEVFGEGRQEGRQEGQEREVSLVLRQLQRRIGVVSKAQQARIAALPIEQVEALGETLLDFTDAADLAAWLAAH